MHFYCIMCNQKCNMLETEQKDIKTVYNIFLKVYFSGNFDIIFSFNTSL